MNEEEPKKLLKSAVFPAILLLIMWVIKLTEIVFDVNFANYGILPLKKDGLIGILCSPLIHGDISHIVSNSIPVFLLSTCLVYFYKDIAYLIFLLIYIITGFWVWVFARGHAYHIGASGLVYGLGAFLFVSGLLRKDTRLMALSMLIAFLYGGLIWGVFPYKETVSWESHLMGLIAGIVLAFYYKNIGPQRQKYEWENEEESNEDEENNIYDNNEFYNNEEKINTEEEVQKPNNKNDF